MYLTGLVVFISASLTFPHVSPMVPLGRFQTKGQILRERLNNLEDHVELRLLIKKYLPEGVTIDTNNGVLKEYTGTYQSAKRAVYSDSYTGYNSFFLKEAITLFADKGYGYNTDMDSIVVINPPAGDPSAMVDPIVKALSLRNMVRHNNVFAVNSELVSKPMEWVVAWTAFGLKAKFHDFAKAIGKVFDEAIRQKFLRPEQINLIGFSYSSHLCGYVARHIEKHSGTKVHSILGLDPYSVGLSRAKRQGLSATDAEHVHIFHTNSAGFGTPERRGTANFVFNGGRIQPGWHKLKLRMHSHERAISYAIMMILYQNKFRAQSCESHSKFKDCECDGRPIITITYPLNTDAKGNYYLNVQRKGPYGLGEEGSHCRGRKRYMSLPFLPAYRRKDLRNM